ncbi:MAG: UDP-N-acetylmuramoyl-L-alanine--D-glutamate ligase [Pseudomonadota bacterium]
MIPLNSFAGRRVGVFGLGRSGMSAAAALKAGGATPVLADDNDERLAQLAADGWETADLSQAPWPDLDLLCLSPGVPHLYPEPHAVVQRAWGESVPVDNDVGLFFAELAGRDVRIVAITGTNGKSTTTALTGHLLAHGGIPTQIGGNIGRGVLDLGPPSPGDAIVLELSSYQTDVTRILSPNVAVFLNLTADHLDRHGGMGGYFAAKARLFGPPAPGLSVVGVDEPEGRFLANRLREGAEPVDAVVVISATRKLLGLGTSLFADDDGIAVGRAGEIVARFDLADAQTLKGRHNAQNAAAAIATARHFGLSDEVIQSGLECFPGLAHRMEILGNAEIEDGHDVLFVNDSKATNADAAAQAMATFPQFFWIAGGQAKDGGIQSLNPFFGRIAHAFLIGQDGPALAAELGHAAPHTVFETLDEAFAAVVEAARVNPDVPVVLFSPACASFDQFADFEQRGDAFRALFVKLAESG